MLRLLERLRKLPRLAGPFSIADRLRDVELASYCVEPLESRLLLANMIVSGTGGDDVFGVSLSGLDLVVTRNSVEVARQMSLLVDTFEISGGDGNDTIYLGAGISSNSGVIHLDAEQVVLQNSVTLRTASAAGNNVTITGRIDADATANNRSLNIATGAGAVTLRDDVGEANALSGLAITATGLIELREDVTTTGDQLYRGAVRIAGASELSAANVTFTDRVDSVSDGSGHLTINLNGTGNSGGLIDFQERVGHVNRLGSFTSGPLGLTRISSPSQPTTQNDYGFETTQFQLFGNAVELGQSTFFGATGFSGNRSITFSSTLRSTGNGNAALGVGTNDVITFNGAVGDNDQRIFSLTTSNAAATAAVGTTTRIHGSIVSTVTTQRHYSDVILDSASNLTVVTTGNNSSSIGLLIFGNLNGAVAGQESLTVSTSGNVDLAGAIGNRQRLDSLTFASVTPADANGPRNVTLGTSLALDGDLVQEAGTGTTTFRSTFIGGTLDVTTSSVTMASNTFNFSGAGSINADVTFNPGSTAQFDINGTTPGIQFDQLAIEGAINLGSAALNVVTSPSLNLGSGTPIVIVQNDGSDTISGTFAGLAEGALVAASGRFFRISYVAGDGNDIALTDITSEVSIAANQTTLNEQDSGTTDFVFTLTRTGNTNAASTVNYTVSSSNAEANDFVGGVFPSGTVTFEIGETSKTISVPVAGDLTLESDESFTVTISQPNAGVILGNATASSTIANDDQATVTLTPTNATQNEGSSGATTAFTFAVTLNHGVEGGFDIAYFTSDGAATVADGDYLDNAGTLSFVGDAGESHIITVTVNHDLLTEADETFEVALGTITGLIAEIDPADLTTTGSPQTGTILNDDFSFVDTNNDGIFNGSDILLDDEIADGVFSTRKVEGNYAAVVRGAGLVISSPLTGETVELRADGNIVIRADISAQTGITVVSTTQDVQLAEVDLLSAADDIRLVAKQRLNVHAGQFNTAGMVRMRGTTGGMEVVDAQIAGTRVLLSGNGLVDLNNNAIVASSGAIKILGDGPLEIQDSTLTASTDILVRSTGVIAEKSSFLSQRSIMLKARFDLISVGDSELRSRNAVILLANASVLAPDAVLQADSVDGRVTVTSRDADVILVDAAVRSGKQIAIRGQGEVDLRHTSAGNIAGNTRGVLIANGDTLQLDNARLVASYRVILRGDQLGTALEINDAGTLPLV